MDRLRFGRPSKAGCNFNQLVLAIAAMLVAGWILTTSPKAYAEPIPKNPYINCVSPGSSIGLRKLNQPRVPIPVPEAAVGTTFGGDLALYVRGDNKSRVRIGFKDANKKPIPNKFVQAGPLRSDAYYSFPCSEGGNCVQKEQGISVSSV